MSMKTKIEQLKEIVKDEIKKLEHSSRKLSKRTVVNELTFIEARRMEDYFLVAYQLMKELKKCENILIGPGWDWMISSHICCALGITCLNPRDHFLFPILVWGNDKRNPTISIEVDEESCHQVLNKAIGLFGYDNVARMPLKNDRDCGQQAYALLICQDGVANHFAVDEIITEKGNKILYTKECVEECDNQKILRFNILPSVEITRIKRIQEQIAKNGKEAPKMYDKWIWNEDYQLFYDGDLSDIPLFNNRGLQKVTKYLLSKEETGNFGELLTILGLSHSAKGYTLYCEENIAEYKKQHGVVALLDNNRFSYPWGFLFKEEVAEFMKFQIGLSWKQIAQLLQYADAQQVREVESLKHFYLHQGMDNGIKEEELNHIWDSLFNHESSKPLPSQAHYAGRLYLSVFLAKLKHQFPEEFNAITNN